MRLGPPAPNKPLLAAALICGWQAKVKTLTRDFYLQAKPRQCRAKGPGLFQRQAGKALILLGPSLQRVAHRRRRHVCDEGLVAEQHGFRKRQQFGAKRLGSNARPQPHQRVGRDLLLCAPWLQGLQCRDQRGPAGLQNTLTSPTSTGLGNCTTRAKSARLSDRPRPSMMMPKAAGRKIISSGSAVIVVIPLFKTGSIVQGSPPRHQWPARPSLCDFAAKYVGTKKAP